MLAELAAANAAYGVIKNTIQNGMEIYKAGRALSVAADNKTAIQKRVASKPGKRDDDFWALEEIKQQEKELNELIIYSGRPGLWQDWLKFQSERKREIAAAELAVKQAEAKRKQQQADDFDKMLVNVAVILGVLAICVFGFLGFLIYTEMKI